MKTLEIYNVTAHTDTTAEHLGFFENYPTVSDIDTNEYRGHSIMVDTYLVKVSDADILTISGYEESDLDDDLTIDDIFQDIDFQDFTELIMHLDPIESEELIAISKVNEATNNLIDNVQSELATRLGRRFFYKYDSINEKTIRIADHTHSPANGKCDLNVVIAEKDATKGRFVTAREDLRFDESNTVEEIVDEILNHFN